MVDNRFLLTGSTLYGGRYIIQSIAQVSGKYIEYGAVDASTGENVSIREFFMAGVCDRNVTQSNSVYIYDPNSFGERMEEFKQMANVRSNSRFGTNPINFFYENATAYIVFSAVNNKLNSNKASKNSYNERGEGEKKIGPITIILASLILVLLVVIGVLTKMVIDNISGTVTKDSGMEAGIDGEDKSTGSDSAIEPNAMVDGDSTPNATGSEKDQTVSDENGLNENGASEIVVEEIVDPEVAEREYVSKLENEISGDIKESFFGDFNDDGRYEMWAMVWDRDGVPYEDMSFIDDDFTLDNKVYTNDYHLDLDRTYKQIQIWYVDEEKAHKIDDHVSIILSSALVNGTSTGWSEDTYYTPFYFEIGMITFEKTKQLGLIMHHGWINPRGGTEQTDKTIALYGNENGPEIYLKEVGTEMDFSIRGSSFCISKFVDFIYYGDENTDYCMNYPVHYLKDKYYERASVNITLSDIQDLPGYQSVFNEAMSQELVFNSYEIGPAANVSRDFYVDNVEFNQYLFNDAGFIYLNGTADGQVHEFVSMLGDIDPYYDQINVCLELELRDGAVVGYRWLGAHQEESATDYEKLSSNAAKLRMN